MTRHEELIARLEASSGPLDAETEAELIAACNGWDPFTYSLHSGDNGVPEILVSNVKGKHVSYNPWPSASIDSALTLVPAGNAWIIYSNGPTYYASAEIGPYPTGGELLQGIWSAEGATPAIALCIASLRARASLKARTAQK